MKSSYSLQNVRLKLFTININCFQHINIRELTSFVCCLEFFWFASSPSTFHVIFHFVKIRGGVGKACILIKSFQQQLLVPCQHHLDAIVLFLATNSNKNENAIDKTNFHQHVTTTNISICT